MSHNLNHWQQLHSQSHPHPHYWNHHFYKRRFNMFYGPSRLVWFAFGSIATWAWIRHRHDEKHHHFQGAGCPPRVGYGYNPGHRAAQWDHEHERDQSTPNTSNNNASSSSPGPSPGRGDFGQQWRQPIQPQPQPPTQPPTRSQSQSQSESMMPTQTPMDRDHERLRQIGRNAEETISGMSEATIDSMMGVLERLKDRLAERRGQQQLQEIGPQQANPTLAASPEEPIGPRHRV
ncbi:hypothetical protein F5888DRAFT_178983 [Russula emetica]|nr:hypothetical protein F5888DRAFT_178983 [Russula emetica]